MPTHFWSAGLSIFFMAAAVDPKCAQMSTPKFLDVCVLFFLITCCCSLPPPPYLPTYKSSVSLLYAHNLLHNSNVAACWWQTTNNQHEKVIMLCRRQTPSNALSLHGCRIFRISITVHLILESIHFHTSIPLCSVCLRASPNFTVSSHKLLCDLTAQPRSVLFLV